MDKKILSAAIIAAMAAPVTAMADTTVYGQVHMSVGAVDDSTNGFPLRGEDNMQVRSHASRLGFMGSEDLGGGLKANFQLEWEVNPDSNNAVSGFELDENDFGVDLDGNGVIGDVIQVDTDTGSAGLSRRNQWIGLSGDNWGEVRVGRHDTPLKLAQGKFDQFNDTDADIKGVLSISQGENRVDNVMAYISPSWSGFSVMGAMIAGEDTKADEAAGSDKTGLADIYSLAGMYENGPLFASIAYEDYDATAGTGSLDTLLRVVGTYSFGDFMVGGLYEMGEDDGNSGDKDVWGLSGKFTMGSIALKAQYLDGTTENAAGVSDTEATQWTLGADYNFSKRTTAYFMYTSAENDIPGATDAGDREYDFAGVGMIHKF